MIQLEWYIIGCDNMKYHINFNDLEEYKKRFREKIDEFADETYNVFKATQNVHWVGLCHDKTVDAIYEQITELGKVYENLEKFLSFFDSVSGEYTEGIEETKKSFKEIDDLINSRK